MKTGRRGFLKGVGGATAAALAMGIASIVESKQQASADSVKRFQVEMYVEEMRLHLKGSSIE